MLVTIRLGDSLPERLLGPWREERDDWLREHPQPWDEPVAREYDERFRRQIERWLDAGHGSCIFNDAESRHIVEEALRFYDGRRYALYSFVVMPNHLHVLLMPLEGWGLEKILEDFKHYVSHRLGKRKCWEGTFWQGEYWDTMIRNGEHFKKALAYIRRNSQEKSWSVYGGAQSGAQNEG